MTNPEVSIIIPVYNARDSIAKCIDSIINQTFLNFEVILVNDGSTDDTLSVLLKYEHDYENIRVINKRNEGVAVTRNKAIFEAKGKYIMFIDNDDFIDKDYIETFYKEIELRNADIIVGGYRRVSEKKELFKVRLTDTDWDKYIVISPWAKIYRRDFIIENNIEFLNYILGEDVYFNLVAYSKTKSVWCIPYIGYNWFDNHESISNTAHKGFKKEADILFLFNQLDSKIDLRDDYTKYYLKRFYIYYLLYSGRTASKKNFIVEVTRIMDWIKNKGYQSNMSSFNSKVSSDKISTKLSIFIFEWIYKLKLLTLFAFFYCKGKE